MRADVGERLGVEGVAELAADGGSEAEPGGEGLGGLDVGGLVVAQDGARVGGAHGLHGLEDVAAGAGGDVEDADGAELLAEGLHAGAQGPLEVLAPGADAAPTDGAQV